MTNDDLIKIGFTPVPHLTGIGSVTYDLGRDRILSAGSVGTPNEMLFIGQLYDSTLSNAPGKYSDLICLHNYDYDGYLTIEKVQSLINLLTGIK